MSRTARLLCLAGSIGLLLACSPVRYGMSAHTELDLVQEHATTVVTLDYVMEMPSAPSAAAAAPPAASFQIDAMTLDEVALVLRVEDDEGVLAEAVSQVVERGDGDGGVMDVQEVRSSGVVVECGWGERCEGWFQVVIEGDVDTALVLDAVASLSSTDEDHQSLDQAQIELGLQEEPAALPASPGTGS